jgi:hypothetical protein
MLLIFSQLPRDELDENFWSDTMIANSLQAFSRADRGDDLEVDPPSRVPGSHAGNCPKVIEHGPDASA